jgi:hypothetical protein
MIYPLQVYTLLGISKYTLLRWTRDGVIKGVLTPNGYRYRRRDIRKYLKIRATAYQAGIQRERAYWQQLNKRLEEALAAEAASCIQTAVYRATANIVRDI